MVAFMSTLLNYFQLWWGTIFRVLTGPFLFRSGKPWLKSGLKTRNPDSFFYPRICLKTIIEKFNFEIQKCWYWILLSCCPYWWYHGSSYFYVGCCQSSIAIYYFWLFRNFWCFLRILPTRSTRSNSPRLCRRGDYRFLLLKILFLIIRVKNLVKENHQHWKISREWLLVCSEQQKQQGNITKSANNKTACDNPHMKFKSTQSQARDTQ